jgi:spermidine synthase
MATRLLRRWMSWLWPVRVERVDGLFGPLEVRWESGRLVVNSAYGNQSFGSLHRVWQQVFEDLDLRNHRPHSVLMLGFGAGSAAHILRNELGIQAPITAVELDPAMIAIANRHFGYDRLPGITLLQGDATILVHGLRERFDLVLVDLFDDLDLARGVDTNGYIHALRDRCTDGGTVCFNTVAHDAGSDERCERVLHQLRKIFHHVRELRYEGMNRVFIAR